VHFTVSSVRLMDIFLVSVSCRDVLRGAMWVHTCDGVCTVCVLCSRKNKYVCWFGGTIRYQKFDPSVLGHINLGVLK
jgi:hypothetical protein